MDPQAAIKGSALMKQSIIDVQLNQQLLEEI